LFTAGILQHIRTGQDEEKADLPSSLRILVLALSNSFCIASVLCPTVNRRSLQRDLKGMLDKNLIVEIGAGSTDPTRHYVLAEL